MEITTTDIARMYSSTLDSVALVQDLQAKTALTPEETDRLKANRDHVETMLYKPFWTTEDLTVWYEVTGLSQAQVEARRALQSVEVADPTVDDLQIRLALTEVGLRDQLEAAVGQADQATKDWYAHAKRFKRHDPLVLAMAQVLQVTDEQLDGLWAIAETK